LDFIKVLRNKINKVQKWPRSRFFPAAPEKMVKNKKYFGFFLVSYISIQKKKCTSEQFLQGRPKIDR